MGGSNGGRSFKEEQSIEAIQACNEGQASGEDGEVEIGGGGGRPSRLRGAQPDRQAPYQPIGQSQ
jgi:hypothetical protein